MPPPTSPSPARRPLGGLHELDRREFRRWTLAAIAVTGLGYLAIFVVNLLLNPLRVAALVPQALTVLAAVVGFGLALRDRLELAAMLTIFAVWIELHATIPFQGLEASALIVFPVVVVAAGVTIGGWGALAVAAASTVTLSLTTFLAHAAWGVPTAGDGAELYLIFVTIAAMFAAAAMTMFGVRAFGQAVRAAQRSERRVADLLRHSPDGVVALDERGRVLSASLAAERLLGTEEPALVGRALAEVVDSMVSPEVRGAVEGLVDGGAHGPVSLQMGDLDSAPRWLEVTVSRMPPGSGEAARQLTFRDVTERVRAEESQRLLRAQLEHAQRLEAVGRLAGGVAHDFNNLLTVVGGSAELIVAETSGETRQLAKDILVAKERGAALTQRLLAFARKEIIRPQVLDVCAVLEDIRPLVDRLLGEHMTLSCELDRETHLIWGDRAQVEQVVVNLLGNAKDATGGSGRVRLGVSTPGTSRGWAGGALDECPPGFVEIWVEDDGSGMDLETRQRVFEPFFTTKPRGQGTGLGLATVHGIVTQNGGRVEMASTPELGTVARVFWPDTESP